MSRVNLERPVARYQPPDWHARNHKLADSARVKREQSLSVRKEAQQLRIETETRAKWHNFDNNMRLSERALEVERWRAELERYLREVEQEMAVMKDAKEACERALEAKVIPMEVVTECLSTREGRREHEVVRDPVEHALRRESDLIEEIRERLKDRCEDAHAQLEALEAVRQRLEQDLEDKTEALNIDLDQLRLTERSAGLSHKPNPTRIPAKSVAPEAWNEFSITNKQAAELELARSQKLRERIFHEIESTSNDLRVQTEATNFEFRKRMYEMRRARDELDYQMRTTKEELEEQEEAIRRLEAAVLAKEAPLKLAETRLENRTNRPHVELCSDLPLDGLIAEVNALRQAIQMLEDKLDNARETDSELEQHLKDLQDDHMRKSQALSLDQRCIDARSRLGTHDQTVKSQTDRNMKLTGALRRTQRFLENSTVVKEAS